MLPDTSSHLSLSTDEQAQVSESLCVKRGSKQARLSTPYRRQRRSSSSTSRSGPSSTRRPRLRLPVKVHQCPWCPQDRDLLREYRRHAYSPVYRCPLTDGGVSPCLRRRPSQGSRGRPMKMPSALQGGLDDSGPGPEQSSLPIIVETPLRETQHASGSNHQHPSSCRYAKP